MRRAVLEHAEGRRGGRPSRVDERHLAQIRTAVAGVCDPRPRSGSTAAGMREAATAEGDVLPVGMTVSSKAELGVDRERLEPEALPGLIDQIDKGLLLRADAWIDRLEIAVRRAGAARAGRRWRRWRRWRRRRWRRRWRRWWWWRRRWMRGWWRRWRRGRLRTTRRGRRRAASHRRWRRRRRRARRGLEDSPPEPEDGSGVPRARDQDEGVTARHEPGPFRR